MELPVFVRVNGQYIRTAATMKYLGVMLDSRLKYIQHFKYIEEKMSKMTRALSALMPNVRGPDESRRRLYANVMSSVALYGAPVWSRALEASAEGKRIFRRMQKTVAVRVCSAYRSVSFDAITLLARTVPYELVAAERRRVYERLTEARSRSVIPDGELIAEEERRATMTRWRAFLSRDELPGRWTRQAILPHMAEWLNRGWGSVNFYTTQLLTDHGGFAKYLTRIQKMNRATCFCCGQNAIDDARHTLLECPTWEVHRIRMTEKTGPLNSLADTVGAITRSKEEWAAFSNFAETVMRSKRALENEQHAREREEEEEQSSETSMVSNIEHLSLAIRGERDQVRASPVRLPSSSDGSGRE